MLLLSTSFDLTGAYKPRENSHTDTRQEPTTHIDSEPLLSESAQAAQLSTNCPSSSSNPSALTLMSHTQSATSSSNFQLIINNALKVYEKRTKKDLLAHPLAAQLQTCGTPAAILAILQEQVQGLDKSQGGDERWSKWLDPTVNVLFAFSSTIGAGVSLVFRKLVTPPRYVF